MQDSPKSKQKMTQQFKIRNVQVKDIKAVYKLLIANRPFVGLNSRYTYFLLARDFPQTCVIAQSGNEIVGFSSGYVPPDRPDTLFNWETVVAPAYRGNSLQKRMLLHQIKMANARYLEGTVNPSNQVSKESFRKIADVLKANLEERLLFTEEDFENDGHEAEVLCRIGPISKVELLKQIQSFA